jgi:nitrite reductase (NADH) large subunit
VKELVVVGNGMVGHRLVQAMRDRDTAGAWRITVLGEESRPAYDRVALSSYVDGKSAEDLTLPEVADPLVQLHLGDAAVALDRDAHVVRTAAGRELPYDALVLATGSVPFVPPVPGRDLPGCFVYRTLDDLDAIMAAAERAVAGPRPGRRSAVVVGGGLLGLEAARALRLLGLSPQVVEIAPRLMPVQVDEGGGAVLRRLVETEDLQVRCGVSVNGISEDRGRLIATLSDGVELDADVVVFSAGIRPADGLAREAGLPVGERGGVLVNTACRTPDPHVWAVGEVAALEGRTYGLVAPGYAMAEVVADRLLGGEATMTPAELDMSTQLKMLGVDVASFGDALARTPGALEVVVNDPVAGTYAKLVVSDDAKTLLGGVLVGDASKYATLRPLVGSPLPADLAGRGGARRRRASGLRAGLLLQRRHEGCDLFRDRRRRARRAGDQGLHPRRHELRVLRAVAEEPAGAVRGRGLEGAVRALRGVARRTVRNRGKHRDPHVLRSHRPVRHGPWLRHLQACGRVDPRVAGHGARPIG